MKKRGKAAKGVGDAPATVFVRGLLVTGLLAAVQDRIGPGAPPFDGRRILRHAVQGGAALTAGVFAAQALGRARYGQALGYAAAGAAGVLAAEILLQGKRADAGAVLANNVDEESDLGQEVGQEG